MVNDGSIWGLRPPGTARTPGEYEICKANCSEPLELRAASRYAGLTARNKANWSIRSVITGLRGDCDSGPPDGSKPRVITAVCVESGVCDVRRLRPMWVRRLRVMRRVPRIRRWHARNYRLRGETRYRGFGWSRFVHWRGLALARAWRCAAACWRIENKDCFARGPGFSVWREGARAQGAVLCDR
jgi:hypothetical protein